MNSRKLIDVFNGDADGLCALMQWRRTYPAQTEMLSGVKRDNALLRRVVTGVDVDLLVLDINFDNNRDDVKRLLADGASIRYFDHHHAGERIEHPALGLTVDESPSVCTSLLVHRAIDGTQPAWAVAGAFGDNLPTVATELARASGFDNARTVCLRSVGELLNYNGYGTQLADLHFDPVQLFRHLNDCADPFDFAASSEAYRQLSEGFGMDLAATTQVRPLSTHEHAVVYVLPDQGWARRVIGVWANSLAQANPLRSHLIFCPDGRGAYTASVRAAQSHPFGAGVFCKRFGGGGREAAGGLDGLAETDIDVLGRAFMATFA